MLEASRGILLPRYGFAGGLKSGVPQLPQNLYSGGFLAPHLEQRVSSSCVWGAKSVSNGTTGEIIPRLVTLRRRSNLSKQATTSIVSRLSKFICPHASRDKRPAREHLHLSSEASKNTSIARDKERRALLSFCYGKPSAANTASTSFRNSDRVTGICPSALASCR